MQSARTRRTRASAAAQTAIRSLEDAERQAASQLEAVVGGETNSLVSTPAAAALSLQRTLGNFAVQRLLGQPAKDDEARPPVGARIRARAGAGRALPADARQHLEASVGADLGHVQVHTDHEADNLAREVQAVAFTSGSNIFFRSGHYKPDTPGGRRLLAHEATHTVQQLSLIHI